MRQLQFKLEGHDNDHYSNDARYAKSHAAPVQPTLSDEMIGDWCSSYSSDDDET
jgi:hypothetical protein